MSRIRKISKILTGRAAVDGAGVKPVRVVGQRDVEDFDPFCCWMPLIRQIRRTTLRAFHGILIGASRP